MAPLPTSHEDLQCSAGVLPSTCSTDGRGALTRVGPEGTTQALLFLFPRNCLGRAFAPVWFSASPRYACQHRRLKFDDYDVLLRISLRVTHNSTCFSLKRVDDPSALRMAAAARLFVTRSGNGSMSKWKTQYPYLDIDISVSLIPLSIKLKAYNLCTFRYKELKRNLRERAAADLSPCGKRVSRPLAVRCHPTRYYYLSDVHHVQAYREPSCFETENRAETKYTYKLFNNSSVRPALMYLGRGLSSFLAG